MPLCSGNFWVSAEGNIEKCDMCRHVVGFVVLLGRGMELIKSEVKSECDRVEIREV